MASPLAGYNRRSGVGSTLVFRALRPAKRTLPYPEDSANGRLAQSHEKSKESVTFDMFSTTVG